VPLIIAGGLGRRRHTGFLAPLQPFSLDRAQGPRSQPRRVVSGRRHWRDRQQRSFREDSAKIASIELSRWYFSGFGGT
jgi:hypothetical protein